MKKIKYMDTSFRDGFQSCFGARVKTEDFIPALEAAVEAGTDNFEIGGGARFQSLYFYCQEDAFDMMDTCRKTVGDNINLQTLARGANVVGLVSQSRDIIDLHAKLFKKHGVSTIRNFDALNDVRNLAYSGRRIHEHNLNHQVVITMMGLPPGLDKEYPHSPEYYIDTLKKIMDNGLPFDSVCFKDASGTSTPKKVYDTIKEARKLLPKEIEIQFHTHDTAGMSAACNMSAVEAGADIIDLAMQPCSGGTGQCDILTMWHRLKGTGYTLDINYEKIIEAEEIFKEHMKKYFIPPESKEVNPVITFSPMPGGALTANTQMMRDNRCLDLFPKVIKEMKDVVARGGFGSSVTPVSQFYFQQAFSNVTQGKWKTLTESYAKMVLGYFGKTPAEPDAEIVKAASEQLKLEPTTEDVHDINDRNPELGIEASKKRLKEAGIETTEENIFIVAACEDKGLEFLKGNKTLGIRYVEEERKKAAPPEKASETKEEGDYTVTVDGKTFDVHVAPGHTTVKRQTGNNNEEKIATSGEDFEIKAPMPGTVIDVLVSEGDEVKAGDKVVILEAMKMETEVKSEKSGHVVEVFVSKSQTVDSEDVLLVIEEGA
ncbi:MAG: biotin/lipoyl-binding protein [Victivallales bacterium]|nr:biotin/lipoyl-binding protein [Victivallales bacterium]MCF7889459.1 biotin/lipoyl-binding protein [Victivallales bacterium]